MKARHTPEIKVGGTQGAPHMEQGSPLPRGFRLLTLSQSHQEPLRLMAKLQTLGRVAFRAAMGLLPPVSLGDSSTRLCTRLTHRVADHLLLTGKDQKHCYITSQWSSEPQGKLWDQTQVHCSPLRPSFPFFLTSLSLPTDLLLATFNANLLSHQTLHTDASSTSLMIRKCTDSCGDWHSDTRPRSGFVVVTVFSAECSVNRRQGRWGGLQQPEEGWSNQE